MAFWHAWRKSWDNFLQYRAYRHSLRKYDHRLPAVHAGREPFLMDYHPTDVAFAVQYPMPWRLVEVRGGVLADDCSVSEFRKPPRRRVLGSDVLTIVKIPGFSSAPLHRRLPVYIGSQYELVADKLMIGRPVPCLEMVGRFVPLEILLGEGSGHVSDGFFHRAGRHVLMVDRLFVPDMVAEVDADLQALPLYTGSYASGKR
ncbi:MAG TPA: hypothetical protein VJB87_03805 [Candidatus Nanoarchaeia archaeon]|nr:hypothetical protein [Candidatus Nanoarchaeia archaeon]